ncbi:MAG: hypothetical protein QXE46_04050 [Candidatus Thermoplasmatota archaeon]
MRERNWKEYNEQLVRRGEFYISLDFMETWDEELEEMNYKKRGRPFHDISCLCSCRFSSISSDGSIFKEVI